MRISRNLRLALAAIAAILFLAACGDDEDNSDPAVEAPGTIVEVAAENGSFTTLLAAAEAAGLVDTLSGEDELTVFAPTDEAFAALPEGTVEGLLEDPEALAEILTYHVVAGEVLAETVVTLDGQDVETVNGATVAVSVDGDTVMVNDATVVAVDVQASNGVIHVIDTVLIPGQDMADESMDGPGTIVDVAVEAGTFTTLVAAVQAAGLVDTLSGEGEFTVFAPNDEAFAALPEGTVEGLLEDPEALAEILTYHVVEGAVFAETVVTLDGQDVPTVNGASVTVTVDGDTVMVNDATVVAVDVPASNGVIHVIDTVLLP